MRKNSPATFVISLGGSLVCPEGGRIDTAFLKKFRAVILSHVRQGERFVIVVGGGKLCRTWQAAARELGVRQNTELDWIGIAATAANAEVVRAAFGEVAHPQVVANPFQKVARFKVLVGCGFVPGHSTDYDAVVRAKTVGARTVINLSNVEYIYKQDPTKFPQAKPLKKLSWAQYQKMFPAAWQPGANVPFDVTAARAAERQGLRVAFLGGVNLENLERFLQEEKFCGTIIE